MSSTGGDWSQAYTTAAQNATVAQQSMVPTSPSAQAAAQLPQPGQKKTFDLTPYGGVSNPDTTFSPGSFGLGQQDLANYWANTLPAWSSGFDIGNYWNNAPTFSDTGFAGTYGPEEHTDDSYSRPYSAPHMTPGWQLGLDDLRQNLIQGYGLTPAQADIAVMAPLSKDPGFIQAFNARYPNTDWNTVGDWLGNQNQMWQRPMGSDWTEQATMMGLSMLANMAAPGLGGLAYTVMQGGDLDANALKNIGLSYIAGESMPAGDATTVPAGDAGFSEYAVNPSSSATPGMLGSAANALGVSPGMLNAGVNFGANYALTGDPTAALKATAIGAGANAAAPYINDAIGSGVDLYNDDARKRMLMADSGLTTTDVTPPTMPAAIMPTAADATPMPTPNGVGMLPLEPLSEDAAAGRAMQMNAAAQGVDLNPLYQGNTFTGNGAGTMAPPPSDTQQPAQKQYVTPQQITKIANTIDQLLNKDAGTPPADAPQRQEGQSDEQYAQQLVQYLNLDADAMAAQGLQPGSPEYLKYIEDQADTVIQQILGDDANSEDLAAALRDKTDEQLQQLQRALFVRGQIDLMMGSGTYTDPLSGMPEDVVGQGMFDPNVAAFQRGRARDVQTLAGMQGDDARNFLNTLLNRDFDPFGMQAQADARYQQALKEDDEHRRRGMLSGSGYGY